MSHASYVMAYGSQGYWTSEFEMLWTQLCANRYATNKHFYNDGKSGRV